MAHHKSIRQLGKQKIRCSCLHWQRNFIFLFQDNFSLIMFNEDTKHNKGVSNDETMRGVSDALDDTFWQNGYKEESMSRAAVHACYHSYVGYKKEFAGNLEGAAAERKRAQEQAAKMVENAKKHVEAGKKCLENIFTDKN
eukprot:TRINITY_DN5171_c0_g1_i2.p3 TRINITY_DN5171_c0_g1~~TRINITY_DN5171_c0_g1_i2.p3  ORF type:complete len:148 (-),score=21.86 TRINITY_DN5171_c0_g1_i2:271-690(-)